MKWVFRYILIRVIPFIAVLLSNVISYLPSKFVRLFEVISDLSIEVLQPETTWLKAQTKYRAWAKQELPADYLKTIIAKGRLLADRIGAPGVALDIGCGNGIIGGMSYEEAGYSYMNPDNYVVGIDPLPLEGPLQPWLNFYVVAVGEYEPFRDGVFTKSVIATTLDHTVNQDHIIEEAARVTSGELYIWTTAFTISSSDPDHAQRIVETDLKKILKRNFKDLTIFYRETHPYSDVLMIEVLK